MNRYTKEDLEEALLIISSIISRCEKAQLKFAEGTSHHTLLTNRINAMYVSKSLITDGNGRHKYTKDELVEALHPIYSVISKCEKAKLKFLEGASQYTRFKKMLNAMYIAKSLIIDEIAK